MSNFSTSLDAKRSSLYLALLILISEMMFFLPFSLVRVFRPTILEVYELTNLQLGSAMSVYGGVAILGYFPGGIIADRFSSKKLMIVSLIVTALIGTPLLYRPSPVVLTLIYMCWGISTVVLFWSASIKAVTQWGEGSNQGVAFGLLEGGRGVVSALLATGLLFIYKQGIPIDIEPTLDQRACAFRIVPFIIICAMLALSLVCLRFFPEASPERALAREKIRFGKQDVLAIFRLPSIWFLSVIIICAYVGFKVTGVFSQYAKEVLKMSEMDALKYGVVGFYCRPVAACLAGYLADKYEASYMICANFFILLVSSLLLGGNYIQSGMVMPFVLTLTSCCLGVYALRGLYFTTIQETKIPSLYTGFAVGIISMTGYSPDIFVGPIIGYLMDSAPGAQGVKNVFLFVASFAGVGLVTSVCYARYLKQVTC